MLFAQLRARLALAFLILFGLLAASVGLGELHAQTTSLPPAPVVDDGAAADDPVIELSDETWLVQQDSANRAQPERTPPRDGTVRRPVDRPQPSSTRRRSPRYSRRRSARLSRIPPMFGDFFAAGTIVADTGFDIVTADLPLAGGSRRTKIAEHNKALPEDRVFVLYNHFHNAIRVERFPPPAPVTPPPARIISENVDQYTFGFEKTFACGRWSVEMRMPFTSGINVNATTTGIAPVTDFIMDGGEAGNLAITLKRMLLQSDVGVLSAGVGIVTPTGSDTTVNLPAASTFITVFNDAVHISPYIAWSATPSDLFFLHAFAQMDIATGGNQVSFSTPMGAGFGFVNEQNLLHFDVSGGVWLYDNPCGRSLTGLAAVLELHHTTTVQDADLLEVDGGVLLGGADVGNLRGSFDVTNLTVGMNAEFGEATSIAVGGVFPVLESSERRFFDAEVQLFVTRKF